MTAVPTAMSTWMSRLTLNCRLVSASSPRPMAVAINRFEVDTITVLITVANVMMQATTENMP